MHFVRVNFAGFFGELFHRNQTRQKTQDCRSSEHARLRSKVFRVNSRSLSCKFSAQETLAGDAADNGRQWHLVISERSYAATRLIGDAMLCRLFDRFTTELPSGRRCEQPAALRIPAERSPETGRLPERS